MATDERVAHITQMEEALEVALGANQRLRLAVEGQSAALAQLEAISDYYGSPEWYEDREADERGELPDDLSRAVLGEDLAYDLLVDARETALQAIEVATALLRVL